MNGLIEKDLKLMFTRKSTIYIMLGIAVMMGITANGSFILGYLVCLGVLYASSTISYDEFDNGYSFLMTLPITANTYVNEKYVFCLTSGFIAWLIGSIVCLIKDFFSAETFILSDELLGIFAFIPFIILVTAFMIPFPLKFGAEKGRLAMMLIFGVIFIISTVALKLNTTYHFSSNKLILKMHELPLHIMIIQIVIVTLVALFISIQISKRIMKNKEY